MEFFKTFMEAFLIGLALLPLLCALTSLHLITTNQTTQKWPHFLLIIIFTGITAFLVYLGLQVK